MLISRFSDFSRWKIAVFLFADGTHMFIKEKEARDSGLSDLLFFVQAILCIQFRMLHSSIIPSTIQYNLFEAFLNVWGWSKHTDILTRWNAGEDLFMVWWINDLNCIWMTKLIIIIGTSICNRKSLQLTNCKKSVICSVNACFSWLWKIICRRALPN